MKLPFHTHVFFLAQPNGSLGEVIARGIFASVSTRSARLRVTFGCTGKQPSHFAGSTLTYAEDSAMVADTPLGP